LEDALHAQTISALPGSGASFVKWTAFDATVDLPLSPVARVTLGNSDAQIVATFNTQSGAPVAAFDWLPPAPYSGDTVTFYDRSLNEPTKTVWDFESDGITDATGTAVQHAFSTAGNYRVRMTVSKGAGDDSKESIVAISPLNSSLDIVDPLPALQGALSAGDARGLVTGGNPVFGVVADGVTPVLLRSTWPRSTSVTFKVATGESGEGALDTDPGLLGVLQTVDHQSGLADSVTVATQHIGTQYVAFAIYISPLDFAKQGRHDNDRSRRVQFTVSDGQGSPARRTFYVIRPPLVFIHGLWSKPETWTMKPVVRDSRWFDSQGHDWQALVDYQATADESFSTNQPIVVDAITNTLMHFRRQFSLPTGRGVAGTQVDIVGHSMGGLLGRLAVPSLQAGTWRNAGAIHKLITLDTPHTGSELANVIQAVRATLLSDGLGGLLEYWALVTIADATNHGITEGAVDDLAKGSPALRGIPVTTVPSHAVVGTPTDPACLIHAFDSFLDAFGIGTSPNDGVVWLDSQQGGLSGAHVSPPHTTLDGCHTHNTGSGEYSDDVVTLLNTSAANGTIFGHFSSIGANVSFEPLSVKVPREVEAIVPSRLVLASPTDGQHVVSGDSILVRPIMPAAGVSKWWALIGSDVSNMDSATQQVQMQVPRLVAGPATVQVFAIGKDGVAYISDPITVSVESAVTVTDMSVVPNVIVMSKSGETTQLIVQAVTSAGDPIDVMRSGSVQFGSSNPEVASVSAKGVVTAHTSGAVTITVRYGQVLRTVSGIVSIKSTERRRAVQH
jgi:PKD repeat protein